MDKVHVVRRKKRMGEEEGYEKCGRTEKEDLAVGRRNRGFVSVG